MQLVYYMEIELDYFSFIYTYCLTTGINIFHPKDEFDNQVVAGENWVWNQSRKSSENLPPGNE